MPRKAVLLLALLVQATSAQTPETLTNDMIVKMVQSGIPVSVIIQTIAAAPRVNFRFLPGDLQMFAQYKVPEDVFKAMAAKDKSVAVASGVQSQSLPAPAISTVEATPAPRVQPAAQQAPTHTPAPKGQKSRERVYAAPFDKVWVACVRAASEKYTVTHSDKSSGVLTFHQGLSWRTNSYGMNVGVTVISLSESETQVILNPQKEKSQISSAGNDITRKFFDAVDKELK